VLLQSCSGASEYDRDAKKTAAISIRNNLLGGDMKIVNSATVPAGRSSARLYKSAIAIAVAAALGSSAMAADPPAPTPGPTPANASGGESLSEVVVTGSRILRRDYSSPSPLVTVPQDVLQSTPEVSVDQALDKLPQFNPGNNQFNQAANVQATATSTPGAAQLNLRGLGINRNLVLIDGHRGQPADASLAIDVNTIPVAALESVEVVTGGAAATYGADALAGVVNFRLKHRFEGIQLDAQFGESQHGDDRNTQLSALIGSNLADNRGNVMFGATFSDRTAVNVRDRAWANAANTDPNTPGGAFPGFPGFNLAGYIPGSFPKSGNFGWNVPSQTAVNQVFSAYPAGTVPILVGPPPGTPTALYFNTAPTTAGATIFSVSPGAGGQPAPGYTGAVYPNYKYLSDGSLATNNNPSGPISAPLRRYSFFGNATYEINDYVGAQLQGYFVRTESNQSFGTPTPAVNQWGVNIPYDQRYDDPSSATFQNGPPGTMYHPVPPELAALLNSRPDPTAAWQLNTFPYYVGNRRTDDYYDTYQMSLDFNGKLGIKDWTWDVYGSIGQTDNTLDYFGFLNQLAYQTLIAAPNYGAGYTANFGLIGRLATCTSGLNPFVNTPVSADCLAIVDAQLKTTTELAQRIGELNIQGALFELPGGEARFAVGADYRFDGIQYRPDEGMEATNIVSNAVGIFGAQPVDGSETVKEGYGELDLPVLGGLPAVKKLNLDAAYRYSDYNSEAGAVSTWKALIDWQVNNYITFRGGPQRANRAPNIGELYTPSTVLVTLWPSGDPCSTNNVVPWGNTPGNPNRNKVISLCNQLSGAAPNLTSPISASYGGLGFYFPLALDQQLGNPALKSERGTTWTVGAVLKAPFDSAAISNFTATIDYYDIKIDGAITPLTSQIVYGQCLNSNGISNPSYSFSNPYCQLIRRSGNGATDTVLGIYTNIGYLEMAGIDTTIDWHAHLADLGWASGPGMVSANLAFSYLQKFVVQVANGDTPVDYAGSTGFDVNTGVQFRWKSVLTLGYSVGPADVSLRWRHLPSVENAARVLSPTAQVADTASNDQFDLFGNWRVTDAIALRAGITNLLDKDPPLVGVTPTNSQAGVTDVSGVYNELGREFYLGVTAKW
jgi:iron complex outermembrane recepter protein